MGFFTKDKNAATRSAVPPGMATMGSGRRLHSDLPPTECARVLERVFSDYRQRRYPALPLLVPAGIQWTAGDLVPTLAISGNDKSDDFVLVTLAPAAGGTEAGLFPLGSGNDRLTLSAVGNWKTQDNSLRSTGTWPAGTVRLTPPPVTDELVDDTLATAGYPRTQPNRMRIAVQLYQMVLVKCWEFISGATGEAAANRFNDGQRQRADWSSLTGPLRAALQGLAEWDPSVLPYIQDFPPRFCAMLLLAERENIGVWPEMER